MVMELEKDHKDMIDVTDKSDSSDWINTTFTENLLKALQRKVESGELAVEDIESYIQKIEDDGTIQKLFLDLVERMSSDSVDTIEGIMYEKVLAERAYTDEFLARQSQKWWKAFAASEALYLCILESTEHYSHHVGKLHEGEENYTYHALQHLHARSLQMYAEIMCLNKNGYADGAYARWRSLYEVSVIASFISKYGNPVAEAYVKSMGKNSKNEWARSAPCFANKRQKDKITFKDIFDNSEINKSWDEEYKFSNLFVHASADATFHRLGTFRDSPVISAGRSDWGMSVSAVNSAMSLVLVTCEFFSVYTHGDSVVAISTFNKWISRIQKFYEEVEDNCFFEDTDDSEITVHSNGKIEIY